MTEDEARLRFASAPVARLATVTAQGHPHLVPIVFACAGNVIYMGIDAKPKRTTKLKRLANIQHEPRVSILVDHYGDDWPTLWWVRADGIANVVVDASERERALDLLVSRYEPYRSDPPDDIVVRVDVGTWRWWSWS